jgi:hypothetical protein
MKKVLPVHISSILHGVLVGAGLWSGLHFSHYTLPLN